MKPCEELMGSLPTSRLVSTKAFNKSGVDYAGPITLRPSGVRSKVGAKGYIAVFVCLVTRTIHLEPVSELTVSAFMAAYTRFTGERGQCDVLWSDNSTTFTGAAKNGLDS